jgi:hypothetical protein
MFSANFRMLFCDAALLYYSQLPRKARYAENQFSRFSFLSRLSNNSKSYENAFALKFIPAPEGEAKGKGPIGSVLESSLLQ